MENRGRRNTSLVLRVIMVVMAATALGITVRFLIFWQVKRTLLAKIETLALDGVQIRYVSLDINSWKGSLRITGVDVRQDSLCRSSAAVERIHLEGIHILPALFQRKLVIDSVSVFRPSAHYVQIPSETSQDEVERGFLHEVEIRVMYIDSGMMEVRNESCMPSLSTNLNMTLRNLRVVNLDTDSLTWDVAHVGARQVRINLPEKFYAINIDKINYSGNDQSLRLDSVELSSTLGRLEFAQQSHHQIDQINGRIPSLTISGLEFGDSEHPFIKARRVALQFKIDVFRDRRFPKATRDPSVLPIKFMRELPFSLHIDSILIVQSFVSYKEVPERGGVPGEIFFDELTAGIYDVSTDSVGETVMMVNSRFMDSGELNARFTFPQDGRTPSTVTASLAHFAMPDINLMLLPIANMEISTGEMQSLKFQFQYDEHEATGDLELRYTDLKLLSIRTNEQRSTNKFATFLINTMVQNSMDKQDPKYKRSGSIRWKRNSQVGVLSYWWKSILAGLKSVFRLDRILGLYEE